jgi:hypothetical protein
MMHRNLLPAPFALLPKKLLIAWAAFLALVALTFVGALLFPGAAWIPRPWLLLVLSLLLILSTTAYIITQVVRAVARRVKH